jgi:hypothetical protein
MQSPVLFTGSPAAGTYKCVIFKMSDVIGMVQSTFYWNAQGSVTEDGGACGIQPGQPEFR